MRRWLRDWRFIAVEAACSLVSVVLLSLCLGLLPLMLITGGVLLLPQAVTVLRWWSDLARRRVGRRRGEPIRGANTHLAPGATLDQRVRFAFSRAIALETVWFAMHALPVLFVTLFVAALPLGALQALAVPFYWQYAPSNDPVTSPYPVTSWELAATMPLVAIAYALISWRLIPAVARSLTWATVRLLSAPPQTLLAERVDALTMSRAAALDAHAAELRRIERDLHDGAQNRLVSVVMMLGMAERALETGSGETLTTLRRAQDAATDALAGLRRTVHDIYPPILDELGLEGALASLAGRSAVPCALEIDGVHRAPAAVESASYFIVAEALTNVNKYSQASRVTVRVSRVGDLLRIVVDDDGVGGAVERPGGGFAGIRRRLAAFEGTMQLSSPIGGPTILTTEMPCGS